MTEVQQASQPNPALKALDIMVGTWDLKGRDFTTKEEISGRSTFEWMKGGFFLVNSKPGTGPDLHRHPYSETWIARTGKARVTADGQAVEAGPGDIIVVTPETPHKFKNVGTDRLNIICIQASPQMIQVMLEE